MKEDFRDENLDTLTKFGAIFQSKAIASLLIDRSFLEQVYDILVPQYFESEANKWIVEKILWYFQEFKNIPTMDVFKKELDKQENDTLKVSIIEQLKAVYVNTKSTDLDYIKNEFLTFCKNQSIKNAVLRSAEMLQRGRYEEIKTLVDKALRSGQERNIGHNWQDDIQMRVSKMARDVVPTPWPCINHLLDGGLGPGELGCIVAPSGIGKSWLLRAIGAEALRRGLRVVDYTFELSETYVGLRYDTIITGIEPSKIKDNVDVVKKEIDNVTGELIIKYFPTRTATVNHLMAHINRMTQLNYKPDLVIVDYADLMRSTEKSSARHEELGFIYEELRGMLGELKIPGWTASQSQRSSLQDDVVEADKIAGAYSKIFVSDVVLSASRKLADKVSNTARIHVIKNRFGGDGMTFPANMDLAHGRMEVYDESSVDGIKIKNQMKQGNGVVQQMLQKRLLDIGKVQPAVLDADEETGLSLGEFHPNLANLG
jgi:replicative DNA helicase